jgi:branched-chain amino acid transport system substrate-binding protein
MLFACGPSQATTSSGSSSSKPIVIGIDASLTGGFASALQTNVNAVNLWTKQVNAKGGILGRQVQLVMRDDKSDPATAVSLYQDFVQQGVDFAFSISGSSIVQQVSTVCEQRQMLCLAPSGFAKSMYQRKYSYLFFTGRALGADLDAGFVEMLNAMAADQRPRSIAYATVDNISYTSEADAVKQSLHLQVVADITYPPSLNDATAIVQNIKKANPDIVFLTGIENDSVLFIRGAAQQGLAPKLFKVSQVAAALPDYLQTVGAAAGNQTIYTVGWDPSAKYPGSAQFVKDYRSMFGVDPTYNGAQTFAAMELLQQAISGAKTTDNHKLRDYVASHSFATVVGTLKFNDQGYTPPQGILVIQFQNGKPVIIWPKDQANGQLIYPRQV